MNRRGALAFLFDAQLLDLEAEDWAVICLRLMNAYTCAKEVVQPELMIESKRMIEKLWFPAGSFLTTNCLVAAHANWGALDLRKCTLGRDAAIDTDVRAERVSDAGKLASLVNAQVPGFCRRKGLPDGTNGSATAATVLEPPRGLEHFVTV